MNNYRTDEERLEKSYFSDAISQIDLRLSLFKCDFPSDIADCCWCHPQKRSNVLEIDLLYDLRATLKQVAISFPNCHSVEIQMLRIYLQKQMLVNMGKISVFNK